MIKAMTLCILATRALTVDSSVPGAALGKNVDSNRK